jgi:hypothetical protein
MSSDAAEGTGGPPVRELLLDRQLPRFDARRFDAILVEAGTEQTYRAVRSLDVDEVSQTIPFMSAMANVRSIPARFGRSERGAPAAPETLSAEQYREAFLPIAEQPGVEVVLGMIGKFMTPTQMEFRRFEPAEFAGFDQPGYGKVGFNFLVLPYGAGRCLLCIETRTATTDPVSAKRLRRYWKVVGPFAGYIMRHWLTLAKQHAEPAG